MNKKSPIVMSFIFIAFFSIAAFAQTQPSAKTALLNTDAFYDEKTGITKLIKMYEQLDAEFKPIQQELAAMRTKMELLKTELDSRNTKMSAAQITAKVDEYEQLRRTVQNKGEDAQTKYNKRLEVLMEPINKNIHSAMDIFFKQKGVTMALNLVKLQGAILWNLETIDMTKEFIAFYNAR